MIPWIFTSPNEQSNVTLHRRLISFSLSPLRHVLNVALPVKPRANDRPKQEFIGRIEARGTVAHRGGVHPVAITGDGSTVIAAALPGRQEGGRAGRRRLPCTGTLPGRPAPGQASERDSERNKP